MGIPLASWVLVSLMNEPIPFAYATECLIEIRPVSKSTSQPKAADLADSHPRVQGEYDRPLILGGPIESELLSGILFAHDFEKVSGLATKGEA